ncbi:hypothetical protein Echvi_2706 [Echinicola vietnamensis DSM 17526]|uniref:DUF3299 domain-containing protein n=2 Tax=Echinicola TaxID=390846 RepID=L0G1S8_ECHVK|nr:hypothetical protein Echvi_2706 [Echinicola vietnamensis DSM 17526]
MIILLVPLVGSEQQSITWESLKDVTFTDRYSREVNAYYYFPRFGQSVKDLDGEVVEISGFMLPIAPEEDFYVLSENPFSSCFFCGSGGPESIIELEWGEAGHGRFKNDDYVTVKGKLRLNQDDIYRCCYILENVVEVK